MNKHFLKNILGWGFLLWLVGYILGIILFMIMPPTMIGWVIMPIGILMLLWILSKKVKDYAIKDYFILALGWTALAIVLDYILLVKIFKPADGYYKLDVYLYYLLTFLLPIIFGLKKGKK